MIDTLRREQACDAILDLVRRHLVGALTPEETQELVDSRRDFRSTSNSPASPRLKDTWTFYRIYQVSFPAETIPQDMAK